MYQDSTTNGYFSVEFTKEVSEEEIQKLFPVLNETAWYKDHGNFNFLKFSFKSKEKNFTKEGTYTCLSKTLLIIASNKGLLFFS